MLAKGLQRLAQRRGQEVERFRVEFRFHQIEVEIEIERFVAFEVLAGFSLDTLQAGGCQPLV